MAISITIVNPISITLSITMDVLVGQFIKNVKYILTQNIMFY